jgi:hypothetical protein
MATGKVSPAISARVVPVVSVSTTLPAWAPAAGAWTTATTNNLTAVAYTVTSGSTTADIKDSLESWNGGGAVPPGSTAYPDGALLVHGGGHRAPGFSNAVYGVDIATRAWVRVAAPYGGPFNGGGAGTYPQGIYPDGSPVPAHTYFYPIVDPVNEQFIVTKGVSSYTASTRDSTLGTWHIYNLAAAAWRRGVPHPLNTLHRSGGRAVWDSRRGCIWVMTCDTSEPVREIVKYSNLTTNNGDGTYGTITRYPFTDNGGTESDAVFLRHPTDPDQDLIVYGSYGSTFALRAVRIVGGEPTVRITLTIGGVPPVVVHRSASLMWSARRNSILYYDNRQPDPTTPGFSFPAGFGRSLVFELRQPTAGPDAWSTGTWSWQTISNASQSVIPSQHITTSGIYSKARLFAYDDGELIVAATRHDTPAYAFRVP